MNIEPIIVIINVKIETNLLSLLEPLKIEADPRFAYISSSRANIVDPLLHLSQRLSEGCRGIVV